MEGKFCLRHMADRCRWRLSHSHYGIVSYYEADVKGKMRVFDDNCKVLDGMCLRF